MPEQDRETRERILDAAHRVFLRVGTAGARTQDIADEAGVNKALLHYYFGSKNALAEAVFETAFAELFPRIIGALESPAPIEEKVRTIIATYLDFLPRRPYLPGYIITEVHAHPQRVQRLIGRRVPAFDVLRGQIRERVETGAMRPIPVEHFVVNLVSLCVFPFAVRPVLETILGLDRARFAAFVDERKATLADFFLGALRP